jgi:hypothetical protein
MNRHTQKHDLFTDYKFRNKCILFIPSGPLGLNNKYRKYVFCFKED